MHLYKKFSARRYIAPTASVKLREGSPKMSRNEHVCAHQVIQEVNFPDNFVAVVHLRECSSAPILRFFSAASDGATAERPIQNRVFLSILQYFEEG